MKKLFINFYNWLADILDIIFNLLMNLIIGKSSISIKKVIGYLTFFLIAYLAIYTDKTYGDLLIFLGVTLGIRSYDKLKFNEADKPKTNPVGFKPSSESEEVVNTNKG